MRARFPRRKVYPGRSYYGDGNGWESQPKEGLATYTWTADGGTISGNSSAANIDTKSAAPGTYTVKGHIAMASKSRSLASLRIARLPIRSSSSSRRRSAARRVLRRSLLEILPRSLAAGMSPQNRPLTYSYSASAGSVTGSDSTATLSTAGAAPGTITVTCERG